MRVLLTGHARDRLRELGFAREDIERATSDPVTTVRIGQTAVEYDCIIRGRPVRIVLVREAEPARVITVRPRD